LWLWGTFRPRKLAKPSIETFERRNFDINVKERPFTPVFLWIGEMKDKSLTIPFDRDGASPVAAEKTWTRYVQEVSELISRTGAMDYVGSYSENDSDYSKKVCKCIREEEAQHIITVSIHVLPHGNVGGGVITAAP
jgi:hypothetical protein